MQKLLRSASLVAVLVTAAPAPSVLQEGVELRWRGQAGDVLRLRMTMTQTIENSLVSQAFESESAFVFRQEVKEVSPEGTGSLDLEYEAIRMEAGAPGTTMDYDSTRKGEEAKKNDSTLAAMFKPILEATVHMKIEPSGRVSEIRGLKETMDEAFGGMEELAPGMGDMFKQMFSEDALRQMVEVNVFPEKKLAPGERWERNLEIDVPMLGTMTIAFENEFEGIEKKDGTDCARIALSGEIELEAGTVDTPVPMEVSLTDSDISGTMYFALDNGFLMGSTVQTAMDLDMSLQEGERELQMSFESEQRTVRLDEDDPLFDG